MTAIPRNHATVWARLFNPARPAAVPLTAPAVYVPPEVGPVHRSWLRNPRDVRLETGWWCPMCDHLLTLVDGQWRCMAASCWAVWDLQGRHGRWIGGEHR